MKAEILDKLSSAIKNYEKAKYKISKAVFKYGNSMFVVNLGDGYSDHTNSLINPSEVLNKEEREELAEIILNKFNEAVLRRKEEAEKEFKEELLKNL